MNRHDLAHSLTLGGRNGREATGAQHVAHAVQRGESVRIVGLGTLKAEGRWLTRAFDATRQPDAYCLTLTTDVIQAFRPFETHGFPQVLFDDIRHIARALGAAVEVWAPGKCVRGGCGPDCGAPKLITTVQP